MNQIRDFWNGGGINKLIIVLASAFLPCLCCISIFTIPSFIPAVDVNEINTAAAQTAWFSITQTAAAFTPTLPATSTFTPTEILTDTPLPTPTISFSAPGATCIPNNPPENGVVTKVIDGDTIVVQLDNGEIYNVRYIGVDSPEEDGNNPFSALATEANSKLVMGKPVILIKDLTDKDKYDRFLRYVIAGDIFVNYELVAQGYAIAKAYPPDTACHSTFETVQQTASTAQLGMWGESLTQPAILFTPTASASGGGPCLCSGNIYNCSDFGSHASAQACYDYCKSIGRGDIHQLDGDSDGSACESLP